MDQESRPFPASAAAGVHGDVIMSKLGNATAKCVYAQIKLSPYIDNLTGLSLDELRGNCCKHLVSLGRLYLTI